MPCLAPACLSLPGLPALAETANLSAKPAGRAAAAPRNWSSRSSTYLHAMATGEVLPLLAAIRLARSRDPAPRAGVGTDH